MLKTTPIISKISIPEPCHQAWDSMTQSHNGRFCGACSKTVVDFTAMSNEQVISYLSAADKTCGRFSDQQFAALDHQIYRDNLQQAGLWKRLLLMATMLTSAGFVKAQISNLKPATEVTPLQGKIGEVMGKVYAPVTYRTVTGTVKDANDNLLLPGVFIKASEPSILPDETVQAAGGKIQAITNVEGKFTIKVPTGVREITVAFIGYDTQTIKLSNNVDQQLDLALKMRASMMGEVVVTRASFVRRTYYRFVKRPFKSIFHKR